MSHFLSVPINFSIKKEKSTISVRLKKYNLYVTWGGKTPRKWKITDIRPGGRLTRGRVMAVMKSTWINGKWNIHEKFNLHIKDNTVYNRLGVFPNENVISPKLWRRKGVKETLPYTLKRKTARERCGSVRERTQRHDEGKLNLFIKALGDVHDKNFGAGRGDAVTWFPIVSFQAPGSIYLNWRVYLSLIAVFSTGASVL